MEAGHFYRQLLASELSRRLNQNPKYSLRAFAKSLRFDVAALSKILARKKSLSFKAANRIATQLNLEPQQHSEFLNSVASELSQKSMQRVSPKLKDFRASAVHEIDLSAFHVISDWYHYGILELSLTAGFNPDPRWIAKALDIQVMEAKLAVERLLDLGLLEKVAGTFRKTNRQLATADTEKTTAAHRKHQIQMLTKAKISVEQDAISDRNSTGMTISIDPQKLPKAKQMIDEFMDQLCEFLESGSQKQVYQLNVNLFPLQKKETVE